LVFGVTVRTSRKTITFQKPFFLGTDDERLPAGDYVVETDEELIQGLSFPAYRRIQTLIHLHSLSDSPQFTRTKVIDPKDLDYAIAQEPK
jgi:hypothetical protein